MIALEKIISSFVSLPGLFLVIWLIITIYLFWKRDSNPFIKLIALLTLVLMIITFTGIGVRFLLFPLENYEQYCPERYQDFYPIVVLGGGINYGVGPGGVELNPISLQRLARGYTLYQKLGGKIIFTGGVGIGHSQKSEVNVAGSWLQKMGVPPADIYREEQALTTYENGIYIKNKLKEWDREKIYLVTSAVHIPRSLAVFKNLGIEVVPVPAGHLYSHRLGWLEYLPNRGALNANMSAIHEWLGIIWYKIKGRM